MDILILDILILVFKHEYLQFQRIKYIEHIHISTYMFHVETWNIHIERLTEQGYPGLDIRELVLLFQHSAFETQKLKFRRSAHFYLIEE